MESSIYMYLHIYTYMYYKKSIYKQLNRVI